MSGFLELLEISDSLRFASGNKGPCYTPGASYGFQAGPGIVSMSVKIPKGVIIGRERAMEIDAMLHVAFESILMKDFEGIR